MEKVIRDNGLLDEKVGEAIFNYVFIRTVLEASPDFAFDDSMCEVPMENNKIDEFIVLMDKWESGKIGIELSLLKIKTLKQHYWHNFIVHLRNGKPHLTNVKLA